MFVFWYIDSISYRPTVLCSNLLLPRLPSYMFATLYLFLQKCILEDAYEDAQTDDMLGDFGGIDTGERGEKNKH